MTSGPILHWTNVLQGCRNNKSGLGGTVNSTESFCLQLWRNMYCALNNVLIIRILLNFGNNTHRYSNINIILTINQHSLFVGNVLVDCNEYNQALWHHCNVHLFGDKLQNHMRALLPLWWLLLTRVILQVITQQSRAWSWPNHTGNLFLINAKINNNCTDYFFQLNVSNTAQLTS